MADGELQSPDEQAEMDAEDKLAFRIADVDKRHGDAIAALRESIAGGVNARLDLHARIDQLEQMLSEQQREIEMLRARADARPDRAADRAAAEIGDVFNDV